VKNLNCLAASLLIEWSLVRNPRAAGIFQPKCLRLFGNAFDIVTIFFIRKMPADRFNPTLSQLRFEFFRWHVVSARQLGVLDSKILHLIQSSRNILFELLAQTIELQAHRSLETLANASVRGVRVCSAKQRDRQ